MKQHLSKLTCSALLGLGLVMAGSTAGSAAAPQVAAAVAGPAIAPGNAATILVRDSLVDRGGRPHRRGNRHRHYRRGGGGVFFNFGGRGGNFSFGVTPPRYYYRAPPRYAHPRVRASRHVQWCFSRYRSYRQWDNTFQPYHGPRKQCISPYY